MKKSYLHFNSINIILIQKLSPCFAAYTSFTCMHLHPLLSALYADVPPVILCGWLLDPVPAIHATNCMSVTEQVI